MTGYRRNFQLKNRIKSKLICIFTYNNKACYCSCLLCCIYAVSELLNIVGSSSNRIESSQTVFERWLYIKDARPERPPTRDGVASLQHFIPLQHCPGRIRRMPGQVCCRLLIILHTLAMPGPAPAWESNWNSDSDGDCECESCSDLGTDALSGSDAGWP